MARTRTPAGWFLAPAARAGNGRGYLTQPQRPLPEVADKPEVIDRIREATKSCDEPESIGPAIVNAYTELARTYDRLRYGAELEQLREARRRLTIEQRMVDVQRRARLRHADVSGEMHMVKCMLERARKGGRQDPPAATKRVEVIEARLDFRPDLDIRDAA